MAAIEDDPTPVQAPGKAAAADAACVLVAAGRSTRFGTDPDGRRKPLAEIEGRSLVGHALAAFAASERVSEVVVVAHADDRDGVAREVRTVELGGRRCAIVEGGAERTDSVRNGVAALTDRPRFVAVHDAARPLVSTSLVDAVLRATERAGAALAALAVRDTIKEADGEGRARATLARERLFAAQTPQAFELPRFRELLARAAKEGFRPTDDAALWERYVGPVALVPGDPANAKITTMEDLTIARALYTARREEERGR